MPMRTLIFSLLVLATAAVQAQDAKLIDQLQAISVTVRADSSQGSGTLVTRKRGDETITFVWTAAHVVDGLRKTRPIVDPNSGSGKVAIEFGDAAIVQEFRQNGRRIGELKMDAKVVRYSDADHGEDLALLQVRKKDFAPADVSAKFYLDDEIPPLGTKLLHVGSLLGQFGSNSLTSGILSQQGRVLNLGANGVIFDQTTAAAFPGSSGGGMFLEKDGRYVGTLVRGAGESFNFIVPVRRMRAWAKKANIEWAIDPRVKVPDDEELAKLSVEDSGIVFSAEKSAASKAYPVLIHTDN
jgi:hypothetical protein